MKIRRTLYVVLTAATFFLSTNVSASESIRVLVNGLLSRRFADVAFASVIDEIQPLKADKEISASLTTQYACSDERVIRIVELMQDGDCARCLRLEFEPVRNARQFVLTTIVFDFEATSRREAESVVKTLLRGAGMPESAVDARAERSATFSDSWTVSSEMRSVTVNVERRRGRWHIWFTHRRDEVPGVPATPR